MTTQDHWEQVYRSTTPDRVSWFQSRPILSLRLIGTIQADLGTRIIDVGGGASTLIDELLVLGYRELAVLDVAEPAIAVVQARLGPRAKLVEWYVADVTGFAPPHQWDIWHDRAVFHFLVDESLRVEYVQVLEEAVAAEGHAIIATFGPAGPTHCSGLPVQRYSAEELAAVLGPGWALIEVRPEEHRTPTGAVQEFIYCCFRRATAA